MFNQLTPREILLAVGLSLCTAVLLGLLSGCSTVGTVDFSAGYTSKTHGTVGVTYKLPTRYRK